MYFNKHGGSRRHERNILINRDASGESFIMPYALAWISAVLLIVIVIFDLPVLLRPHAVAAVSGVGEAEAGVIGDEESDYYELADNDSGSVYVRYVAMGEERTSILKQAPRGLAKGDIVIVSYSVNDPYDVAALRIYRYIFHGFVFLFCVIVFGYMWHSYNTRRFADMISSRTERFF